MITIVNQTKSGRTLVAVCVLHARQAWPRTMRNCLQGHASIGRLRGASAMRRVYYDQSSKMHSVRFFIVPHWVLGQCENLISERFFHCPFAKGWLQRSPLSARVPTGGACCNNIANVCFRSCPSASAWSMVGREAPFGRIGSLSGARSWARLHSRNRESS